MQLLQTGGMRNVSTCNPCNPCKATSTQYFFSETILVARQMRNWNCRIGSIKHFRGHHTPNTMIPDYQPTRINKVSVIYFSKVYPFGNYGADTLFFLQKGKLVSKIRNCRCLIEIAPREIKRSKHIQSVYPFWRTRIISEAKCSRKTECRKFGLHFSRIGTELNFQSVKKSYFYNKIKMDF